MLKKSKIVRILNRAAGAAMLAALITDHEVMCIISPRDRKIYKNNGAANTKKYEKEKCGEQLAAPTLFGRTLLIDSAWK